jgi:hypothetical protein
LPFVTGTVQTIAIPVLGFDPAVHRGPAGTRGDLVRILLAGLAVSVVIGSCAAEFGSRYGVTTPPLYLFLHNFSFWLGWTLLGTATVALCHRLPLSSAPRLEAIGALVVFAAIFIVGHVTFVSLEAAALNHLLLGVRWDAALQSVSRWPQMRAFIEWECTAYLGFVALAHALLYRRQLQERDARTQELEGRLAVARLDALQRQLQPHFFFNTLHTISSLMHTDVRAADGAIERLGHLLRRSLRIQPSLVSLGDELDQLRIYLELEQANMGSRLEVRWELDEAALHAQVPTFLLQPLAENAVRHGIARRSAGGAILIQALTASGRLRIAIVDNGVGFSADGLFAGVGLQNTATRLRYLYGDDHVFSISGNSTGGVTVSIDVPLETGGEAPGTTGHARDSR